MGKRLKLAVVRPGIHPIDEQPCYFLAKNGFDVTLFAPYNSESTPNEAYNPNYKIVYYKALNRGWVEGYPIPFNLYSRLSRVNPDIIYASEDSQPITWIASLFAQTHRKRLILCSERYQLPTRRVDKCFYLVCKMLLFPYVWGIANRIICRSIKTLKFMRNEVSKQTQKKLVYLPMGVNTEIFYPTSKRKERRTLNIITVARLLKKKEITTLIKAVALIKNDRNILVKLSIVGKGPLYDSLREEVRKQNLVQDITFVQNVQFFKMRDLYNQHNLFILPSSLESLGAAVLEAMACGLPVIISNVGGMLDFVKDGKNGYIFQVGDHKDLANKIMQLTDMKKRRRFGQESLRLVKEKFDWSILIQKYANVISA